MKILVYGSLNIDLIFSVDHIVAPGETISSSSLVKSAGGKGANQAAALAKAGMRVYMAGKIGQDGLFLPELLQSYGVDTGRIVRYEGATGQAIIQLDKNKQNSIVLFSGGNGAVSIEEIHRTIAEFNSGDLVVLQNEIVHVKEIMECAKQRGLRICLNPSPYNEKIEALPLNLTDIFFVNEIEGAALAGMPPEAGSLAALEKLVKRFPNAEIVLTAGKAGAYYGFGETRAKGDIVKMPVADTTGAGDTFTGYFIAARARNMPVGEALAAACKAASIAVSRKGAMESIPLAKEVFS
ncbi:MAG: PfkB family carbohydrate kinase [Treponema sp.]|jgi:ribokinase|nr:PfkB family carbohydrate kinase [Treponema sp.]